VLTFAFTAVVVMTTTGPATARVPAASRVTQETAVARAEVTLRAKRGALAATEDDEFRVVRTIVDPDGASHVRYSRTYKGLPVYGGDIVVHNRPDGSDADSSVGLAQPLRLEVKPVIAKKDAARAATGRFSGEVNTVSDPALVVEAANGFGRLAYETVVSGVAADKQTPSVLHVLVDAITGEVIRTTDEVESIVFDPVVGTGNTYYSGTVPLDVTYTWDQYLGFQYRLIDQVRGGNTTCDMWNAKGACSTNFPDEDGIWGDGTVANRQSVGADAHYGAAMAYDYFKNVHGHVGVFGDGSGVQSMVHFGNNVENAFWNNGSITYGDGDGNRHPFTTLDVVGHEMTHGVTQVLAGLIYKDGETGGLNEATSDIFGTMIEFYAANPNDPGDYDIGEKIDNFGTGGSIRYLYNPGHDGFSYSCWDPSDAYLDPHRASGPGNHFFFNLAEGSGDTQYGTSPLCGNAPPVVGIGRDEAAQIWFRALSVYFVSNTTYVNPDNKANTARAYTLRAAADLFGWCSPQMKAVNAAWVAVNVASSIPCAPTFEVNLDHLVVFVGEGGTAQIQTHLEPGADDPGTLVFSASGLPEGARATFEPGQVRAGDKLAMTIQIPTSARPGSYQITVTATSKAGAQSATLALTVAERR
jgi:Zn-dependent metalloprotease